MISASISENFSASAYALLVLVDVDGSHGEVGQIGGPPQRRTQIVDDGQTVSISKEVALYWELQKAIKVVLYTYAMQRRMIACLMVICRRHLIANLKGSFACPSALLRPAGRKQPIKVILLSFSTEHSESNTMSQCVPACFRQQLCKYVLKV